MLVSSVKNIILFNGPNMPEGENIFDGVRKWLKDSQIILEKDIVSDDEIKAISEIGDIPKIIDWLKQFSSSPNETQIENLTFYGGEPFIWVDLMDQIMEEINKNICR